MVSLPTTVLAAALPDLLPGTLRTVFFTCAALFLILCLGRRPRKPPEFLTAPPNPVRLLPAAAGILLAAVLCYQATWQLAGFARPRFVAFMRAYNRRSAAGTRGVTRGRILDRNGFILAADDPLNPGRRIYSIGAAGVHPIGYSDRVYGLSGIEKVFDTPLSGLTFGERDDLDRFKRTLVDRENAAGKDLTLTLDMRLQFHAYSLLKGRPGACVVLAPATGDILALVSSPSLDPNRFGEFPPNPDDEGAPMLNRALKGRYPPGSAFKVAVAAEALAAGITPLLDCPTDGYRAPGAPAPIRDHEYYEYAEKGLVWPGRRSVSLNEAFIQSSNAYFAQLGVLLGTDVFNRMGPTYHLNDSVGIDRRPEDWSDRLEELGSRYGIPIPPRSGTRPDSALTVTPGNLPTTGPGTEREVAQGAIGQGKVLVTPMHMAMLAAAVANDGVCMRPRITPNHPPEILGAFMPAEAAATVRAMMRRTVVAGTGRKADVVGLGIAGKTGTAQTAGGPPHSWFLAIAPWDRPQVAVAVLVEHGGYGSAAAAPLVADLMRRAAALGWFETPDPPATGEAK